MQTNPERISLRLPTKLRRRIEKMAKREGTVPSTFIRWCIETTLADIEPTKPKHPKEGF